jgi:hypothetical protein
LALDRVLKERGREGYAKFKSRFRLSSADRFGDHTRRDSPWTMWVETNRPELDGKRWYHRFSALTATAGGLRLNGVTEGNPDRQGQGAGASIVEPAEARPADSAPERRRPARV